jgi:hypothetical protein
VLPHGERLSVAFAVAFIGFGIWVAAAPGSVPGLTRPGTAPAMDMGPKMKMEPKTKMEPRTNMEPGMKMEPRNQMAPMEK